MVTRRILDLCCCAGAASEGYRRAGFVPTGVDIEQRDNYPFTFLREDALAVMGDSDFLSQFDAIHASPPCQAKCSLTLGTNKAMAGLYTDIYPELRDLMYDSGLPGVIENPAARADMVLCGEMFGLGVIRHRRFELVNWTAPAPAHKPHRGRVRGYRHGVWHDGPYVAAYGNGGGKASVTEMQDAMDIHWTSVRSELTEAIPPAFTHFVGKALVKHLNEG